MRVGRTGAEGKELKRWTSTLTALPVLVHRGTTLHPAGLVFAGWWMILETKEIYTFRIDTTLTSYPLYPFPLSNPLEISFKLARAEAEDCRRTYSNSQSVKAVHCASISVRKLAEQIKARRTHLPQYLLPVYASSRGPSD